MLLYSQTKTKTNQQPARTFTKKTDKVKTNSDVSTGEHSRKIVERKRYGDYDFPVDADGFVHVYTDGSCENNGRAGAIAGYGVYFDENHPLYVFGYSILFCFATFYCSLFIYSILLLVNHANRNVAAPVIGPATNNRGEIQAATRAIKLAAEAGVTNLCIFADSKFVIQSVTEWMSGWKKRGWKLSAGGPVKNETDFKKLDAVINKHPSMNIRWRYVPAHTGIHGNERADELAKLGGKSYNKIIPLVPVRFEPYAKK